MDINNIKRAGELSKQLEVVDKLLSPTYTNDMWICHMSMAFEELLGEELWDSLKERVINAIIQEKEQIEKEIAEL